MNQHLLFIRFAEITLPAFEEVYPEDKRTGKALKVAKNYLASKTAEDEMIFASDAAMADDRSGAEAAWDAT